MSEDLTTKVVQDFHTWLREEGAKRYTHPPASPPPGQTAEEETEEPTPPVPGNVVPLKR